MKPNWTGALRPAAVRKQLARQGRRRAEPNALDEMLAMWLAGNHDESLRARWQILELLVSGELVPGKKRAPAGRPKRWSDVELMWLWFHVQLALERTGCTTEAA